MDCKFNNTRFQLERYHTGGTNRFPCPQCGRRKCFTRYIDMETGQYLSDDCGKCNHESSCGYHYKPSQFFRDHPEYKVNDTGVTTYANGMPLLLKRRNPMAYSHPQEFHQTEFYPIEWAQTAVYRHSPFKEWFMSMSYSDHVKADVLMEYYVGATEAHCVKDGVDYGPATVFWMIDEQQRVHDGKMIAYKADGHRVQDWGNSVRSECKRKGQGLQLEQTEKVFFGLHLLPRHPEKTVCIVESEKTALVCACHFPDRLWIATGGCGNLQAEKLKPLMGRKLLVFPDSGELEKWRDKMKQSGHKDYRIIEYMENYVPNTDIADLILGQAVAKMF